jgi:hypothetical protein
VARTSPVCASTSAKQPPHLHQRGLALGIDWSAARQGTDLPRQRLHAQQQGLPQRLDIGEFAGEIGEQHHHPLRVAQIERDRRLLERPLHAGPQPWVGFELIEVDPVGLRHRRIGPRQQSRPQPRRRPPLVLGGRVPARLPGQHLARQFVADLQRGHVVQRLGDQPQHAAIRAGVRDGEFALQRDQRYHRQPIA